MRMGGPVRADGGIIVHELGTGGAGMWVEESVVWSIMSAVPGLRTPVDQ